MDQVRHATRRLHDLILFNLSGEIFFCRAARTCSRMHFVLSSRILVISRLAVGPKP